MPHRRLHRRCRLAWHKWIRPLLIVLVVLTTFRSAVADWHDVPTQSMEPTILVGDRIVVNKLAYDLRVPFTDIVVADWSEPARGDVVVFHEARSDKRMVKRVIAVAGDRVSMRGNRLRLNGDPVAIDPVAGGTVDTTRLSDPPPHRFYRETRDAVQHRVLHQPARGARRDIAEVRVPPGHVFVMGDNRDNSGDSRVFGMVPLEAITGRAFGIGISIDRNDYRARMDRFFVPLD